MNNTSNQFMEKALILAKEAAVRQEIPVGALITDSNGNIIASASNMVEELKDITAHAEILAIKEAAEKLGTTKLEGCDLYVTLEPCPMCATAISFSRIRRLYFGAYDIKSGGVEHGPRIFNSSSCHHKPEIYGGIMETACSKILKDFFNTLR